MSDCLRSFGEHWEGEQDPPLVSEMGSCSVHLLSGAAQMGVFHSLRLSAGLVDFTGDVVHNLSTSGRQ